MVDWGDRVDSNVIGVDKTLKEDTMEGTPHLYGEKFQDFEHFRKRVDGRIRMLKKKRVLINDNQNDGHNHFYDERVQGSANYGKRADGRIRLLK